jgi:hypothetical protein
MGAATAQGSVVIQCMQDVSDLTDRVVANDSQDPCYVKYAVPVSENDFNIDVGNLVYQVGTGRGSRGGGRNAPPVSAALNGIYARLPDAGAAALAALGEGALIDQLSQNMRVFGVSLGATTFGDGATTSTQISVRTRGTCTIVNNSTTTISAGDVVLWKIPDTAERAALKQLSDDQKSGGTPFEHNWSHNRKTLLMTVPLKHSDIPSMLVSTHDVFTSTTSTVGAHLKKMATAGGVAVRPNASNDQKDEYVQKYNALVGSILDQQQKIKHRTIGKALTTARAGHTFDILIGGE